MCGQNKIAAVILAAGYSSRMGEFKPLMKLNGQTVIESAVGCFQRAGISDIMVVVGYRASEVIEVLDTMDVGYILNDQYHLGMFSSVQKGVGAIADYSSGFFLLPGDMPLVKYSTIERIVDEVRKSDAGIIYPGFLGKRGHPPYISSKYFSEILSSDVSDNLQALLRRHESDSLDIELIDQTILMDVDTPEDFQETVRYLEHQNTPSADECQAILLKYRTSETIIKHGEAVAEISCRIAELLNATGKVSLDIDLIYSAAILHDIAREKPDHAMAGAEILSSLEYYDVAEIISSHMDIKIDCESPEIDGKAIVYLADKMVKEDILVPFKERFAESINRYSGDPDVVSNILKRQQTALMIKKKIEIITGISELESVLQNEGIRK